MRYGWVLSPHTGGQKIPEAVKHRTEQRLRAHAEKRYKGRYSRLDIRFKGPFCYIDAYREPKPPDRWTPPGETREQYIERLRNTPTHLCRLRHFTEDSWSLAFYTYSHKKYEPCVFESGEWFGTPEEGFDIGAVVYLPEPPEFTPLRSGPVPNGAPIPLPSVTRRDRREDNPSSVRPSRDKTGDRLK